MYAVYPAEPDQGLPDFMAATGEWFNVEGDLHDFIFFDPTGLLPEVSGK